MTGDVGQHLARDNAPGGATDGTCRGDIVEIAHLLRGAAQHHGVALPFQKTQHQNHHPQRTADQGHRSERDQDHRQRKAHRNQIGHDQVGAPAEITGHDAEHGADHARDQHHRETDQQRYARAVDRPRQVVAPEHVGAQRMGPASGFVPDRRNQPAREVLRERVMRREPGRGQRHQHDEQEHACADQQARVAAHAPAQQLAWRGSGEGFVQRRLEARRMIAHVFILCGCADPARHWPRPRAGSARCTPARSAAPPPAPPENRCG